MNLEQPAKLCEVNNKSKCKFVTSYIFNYNIFIGVTSIVSGDSKSNPVVISDKSPIKDENDWWIKNLKLKESDRVLLLNGSDLNDTLINAAHSLLSSQFSEIEGFQNTILVYNLKFQPVSNTTLSIQILHAGT